MPDCKTASTDDENIISCCSATLSSNGGVFYNDADLTACACEYYVEEYGDGIMENDSWIANCADGATEYYII